MKITHVTKRIQQPIKMHVLYMAKHQFRQCWRGSKLGHGYVPGDHPRDDIDGFKINLKYVHIPPKNSFSCVFNVAQYTCCSFLLTQLFAKTAFYTCRNWKHLQKKRIHATRKRTLKNHEKKMLVTRNLFLSHSVFCLSNMDLAI